MGEALPGDPARFSIEEIKRVSDVPVGGAARYSARLSTIYFEIHSSLDTEHISPESAPTACI
jgi:hypothetical protein